MAICPSRGKCEFVQGAQAVIRIGSIATEIDFELRQVVSLGLWKSTEVKD